MGTAHDDATDAEIRANQEDDDDDERDQDDEPGDNLPTLYIDGTAITDARGADHSADLWDIERVQLEFDTTANGAQSPAQERGPLGWCNSATIHLDRDDDAVHVLISVGDPRGAFAFTVRRLADGKLIMHTPYPGESMPHMSLTELHPGTYEIGS